MMKSLAGLLLTALVLAGAPALAADERAIYLVRHAEKQQDTDPALTEKGSARALALAVRLADVDLAKIYSTDTRRTRDTAAPTLTTKGLSLSLYDPRVDFRGFADALKAEFLAGDGSILVVGHSNTTPYLAGLLVGEEIPMLDDSEYSHIFIVSRGEGGALKVRVEYFEP